jgi:protoheme IX farnesyltransferase
MTNKVDFKGFYSLTKSGLVFGNLIPLIAGFALGSHAAGAGFNWPLFFITALGLALVMAAGCVFNNYLERGVDGAMERTKNRVLVTGRIAPRAALAFGTALGAAGFLALVLFTNAFAVGAALVGFFFYVFMYTAWFKRRSVWGALVGAVAGATPPVVGYAAASGRIDGAAALLFVILFLWQMPHFYAIAIRRREDYAAAKIPVLPVKRGIHATKIQMLLYVIAFTLAAPLLAVFGYVGGSAGVAYFAIAPVLGLTWIALCIKGFWEKDEKIWAKRMFLLSLVVMVVLFATMTIGAMV